MFARFWKYNEELTTKGLTLNRTIHHVTVRGLEAGATKGYRGLWGLTWTLT